MIIKISVKTAVDDGGWRFYDNATRVESSLIPFGQVPKLPEDFVERTDYKDSGRHSHTVLLFCGLIDDYACKLTFDTGVEHWEIYTLGNVYLLNDSGKTIEKLH